MSLIRFASPGGSGQAKRFGTEKSIENLTQRCGLNVACRYALARLGKPGKAGANLVALFRTGTGMSQLVLSLTIGPQSLWAFSTTTEDVAIRNNLYQRLGPSETLRRRAKRFPGGRLVFDTSNRRAVKMMLKTWVKTAGITDVEKYFYVNDVQDLGAWLPQAKISA